MSARRAEPLSKEHNAGPPAWLHRVLYACFFLSGAAGLIYQVSWLKALGLIFGKTTYALTAVLCAFMAGLALGSWWLGRRAERVADPLKLYAWIELGIGLAGLASFGGLWLTRWLYVEVYQAVAQHPALLLGYRFLASFLVLLVPTTFMGGTYPVVLKYLARQPEHLGALASRLYWLNTAGAITGVSLAGFVLLWHLGLVRTLILAAALNLIVAGLVWLSAGRVGSAHVPAPGEKAAQEEEGAPAGAWWVLLISAVSGLTGMMFEIGWTRILAIFLSSTTYAFTLMLVTFLFGITLGSYLFERWHRRWKLTAKLLGQFLTVLALGALLFLAIANRLPELTLWLTRAAGESGTAVLAGQFVVCFLAMVIPTTLFGLIFPLTVVLYCGGDPRRGEKAGRLYAVNTLGAIVGAFVTGLFLIQWLNTVNTLLLGVGLNAAVAAWLFARGQPPRDWMRVGLALGVGLAVVGAAGTAVFAHTVFYGRTVVANAIRPEFQGGLRVEEIVHAQKLVYVREGLNTTVVVARQQGNISLETDGKTEASSGDQRTQLLLAYLPLALHPQPRRVLVVGFGGGSTVYAATQFASVERVDCVEIEPAVLEAASHLQELNHGVYQHPKVRLIEDDARNYLMVTRERYDVIISAPSYLWSAGIASLFTREFYRQVREHLEPGGLFAQWFPSYQLAPRDMASVVRTLRSNFDAMSLWYAGGANFLVVAGVGSPRASFSSFLAEYQRNPALRTNLATHLAVAEPVGLLGYYLLNDAALRLLGAAGELNTDDRTVLEYRAPFSLVQHTDELNMSLVRRFRQDVFPPFVNVESPAGALVPAAETQMENGMLALPLGAASVSELLRSAPDSPRSLLVRARVALHQRRPLAALEALERAERLDPRNPAVAYWRGWLHLSQGQVELGRRALERCLALAPKHIEALQALVGLEIQTGRRERALQLQHRLIAAGPPGLYAEWARLGELYFSLGELERAAEAFDRSLELEPLGYTARRQRAELLLRAGRLLEAIEEYKFLLQFYPADDPGLYLQLSALYRQAGLRQAARATLRKAKRIFPTHVDVEQALW